MVTNFDLLLQRLENGTLAKSLVSELKDLPSDQWPQALGTLAEREIEREKSSEAEDTGEEA